MLRSSKCGTDFVFSILICSVEFAPTFLGADSARKIQRVTQLTFLVPFDTYKLGLANAANAGSPCNFDSKLSPCDRSSAGFHPSAVRNK